MAASAKALMVVRRESCAAEAVEEWPVLPLARILLRAEGSTFLTLGTLGGAAVVCWRACARARAKAMGAVSASLEPFLPLGGWWAW